MGGWGSSLRYCRMRQYVILKCRSPERETATEKNKLLRNGVPAVLTQPRDTGPGSRRPAVPDPTLGATSLEYEMTTQVPPPLAPPAPAQDEMGYLLQV